MTGQTGEFAAVLGETDMENAQLVGLARQATLTRQLDLIANNLANVNTGGYKAQKLVFTEQTMPNASDTSFLLPDRPISFVMDDANLVDFTAGQTVETGNPTDVAINGEGWFTVQTPDGDRYTRNGSFVLNNLGQLVTQNNYPVMSDNGPVTLQANEGPITIADDGTISTKLGKRGKLTVVSFDPSSPPIKVGETLFTGSNPTPVAVPQVVQGRLEKSNVNGVVELTNLINVQRSYDAVAKMMQQTSDLRKDAISTLGQVN
jgi:flagellar basal-body rod protein FlgF